MSGFLNLLTYTLSFLLVSNFILTRGVGVVLGVSTARGYGPVFSLGLGTTLSAVILSFPGYGIACLMRAISVSPALEPLFFCVPVIALYLGLHFLFRRFIPTVYKKFAPDMIQSALNIVVLSALLIPYHEGMAFGETVLFGLETGLSFLLGSLILFEGQRRLSVSPGRRIFHGLPVTFLYVGILAMAFYGLVGHQLPY